MKVDSTKARITIDGVPLPVAPDLVYYLLYKPRGVISTTDDPAGRTKVTDLLPDKPRVYPVGRLDVDSEGLMVLTNDGALTNMLTHPRFGIEKIYLAKVKGILNTNTLNKLTAGVELNDGLARALRARVRGEANHESLLEIVMVEGRKREVRRMLFALGHEVTRLVRTAVGPIRDRSLSVGEWRTLTAGEIRELYGSSQTTWDHH